MRIVLATLLILLGAGCGGSSAGSPGGPMGTARSAPGECAVYLSGSALSIVFSGFGAARDCAVWIQKWSIDDDFWTRHAQPAARHGDVVCKMQDAGIVAAVSDAGRQHRGRSVCASFTRKGWTELP